MAKLWAGRFGKETDLEVNDFNSSISFDCRLYKEDITGSMAHAAMLGKQGIIAKEESDKIIEGLKGILADIEAGKIHFSQDYEDIHMNVEQILTERIGDAGKRPVAPAPEQNMQRLRPGILFFGEGLLLVHWILHFSGSGPQGRRKCMDAPPCFCEKPAAAELAGQPSFVCCCGRPRTVSPGRPNPPAASPGCCRRRSRRQRHICRARDRSRSHIRNDNCSRSRSAGRGSERR